MQYKNEKKLDDKFNPTEIENRAIRFSVYTYPFFHSFQERIYEKYALQFSHKYFFPTAKILFGR